MSEFGFTAWTPVFMLAFLIVLFAKGYGFVLVAQALCVMAMIPIVIGFHYCVDGQMCAGSMSEDAAFLLDYHLAFASITLVVSCAIQCSPGGISIEDNNKKAALYIYIIGMLGVILVLVSDRSTDQKLIPMIIIAVINFLVLCYTFSQFLSYLKSDRNKIMTGDLRFFSTVITQTFAIIFMIIWAILRLVQHIDSSKIPDYPWHGVGHILAALIAVSLMAIQPSNEELQAMLPNSLRYENQEIGRYGAVEKRESELEIKKSRA